MKGQLKIPASPDLLKVTGGPAAHKGDYMTGTKVKQVGKHSSIRCGSIVDVPGAEGAINPLKGLPKGY